ncbi:KamA family radical SAM protein [Candidatus Micrarchaeota archaeon CG10_big_fil_rev_8_21_14_0_10_45_29]|nr:MAG: KamA family radical SAM protein [Candidatus Micrarchaeota archaeon CG10_big_fil_rev_8_21_14_0_10_45_29]
MEKYLPVIMEDKEKIAKTLHKLLPGLMNALKNSKTQKEARHNAKNYLAHIHISPARATVHNWGVICRRRLTNIMRPHNEKESGFSTTEALYLIAKDTKNAKNFTTAYLNELLHIFMGISIPADRNMRPRREFASQQKEAQYRSSLLDGYSLGMQKHFKKFSCGLDASLAKKREKNKKKILAYFGGSQKDWDNWLWHLRHIIKEKRVLEDLLHLNKEELAGLSLAEKKQIPFNITPYYLSLFDFNGKSEEDRAIRAQVLPKKESVALISKTKDISQALDFMGERFTSPIQLITRRYPQIVIIKPFDACPQICQYCQRNWELKTVGDANLPAKKKIDNAINWVAAHKSISEVLITGGDPLTLNNKILEDIISKVAKISNVQRIRIGTRTPVTLPFRIDSGLINILKKFHKWGEREICIVTHFEHASEITPQALEAIKKIKNAGLNVYNQQVFTYYNSRRFETAFLRKNLKLCGIDPYYSFNTKGKEETRHFMVPISRIKQERWEEARLLPGIVRTDEPVFNIPKIGKAHLRAAGTSNRLIGLTGKGERVYKFFPWEVANPDAESYVYTDVGIYDYLRRLEGEGEKIGDYSTIWYY